MRPLMYSERIGNEIYVYHNGKLIYKRWLKKQSKDQQLSMWNATNYGAQTAHLQEAGLNPALMYEDSGGAV